MAEGSGFIDLGKEEKEEEILPSLEKLKEKADEKTKRIVEELIGLISSKEISSLIITANTPAFESKEELNNLKQRLMATSDRINFSLLNASEIIVSSSERELIDRAKEALLEKKELVSSALNTINIRLKEG